MSRKQKLWALTIFSATVMMVSSVLGAALYSSETASGGIEMKWHMNLYNGETFVCQFNDLMVVNDQVSKQLRFIDTDGNTVRNHQYTDFWGLDGYYACSGDRF